MSRKLLYIADLDGTLLNSAKEVSECSQQVINNHLARGGSFTIATARTLATTERLVSALHINIPVILMNGVAIYDLKKGVYDKVAAIPAATAEAITEILEESGIKGFMYSIENNQLNTYYEDLNTPGLKTFHDNRVRKFNKFFQQVSQLKHQSRSQNVVYFTLIDEFEPLTRVGQALGNLPGINVLMYRDIYSDTLWYLEIYGQAASKRNAVVYLRERYGFDYVIGFGDNLNDLSLVEACDECYAVANAVDELKDQATGVIGDNNSHAVARFIAQREELLLNR